jgi:hypothetical protein
VRRAWFLALLLAACSPQKQHRPCSLVLPDGGACSTDPPSYANDVAPLLTKYCVPCHRPGGVNPTHQLDTYAHVYDQRRAVLSQVYSCNMPPDDQAIPSDAEAEVILDWLVCGAPNN